MNFLKQLRMESKMVNKIKFQSKVKYDVKKKRYKKDIYVLNRKRN